MSRTIARAALAGVAALLMAAGSTAAAQAANFPHDGNRAYEDGCRADQQTIYHRLIKKDGNAIGYVDLMYSLKCHTAWAHVHSSITVVNQTWVTHGLIHRNYDGKQFPCTGTEGSNDCYTAMVYDKGMTSWARGTIDPNGATNTQYSNTTPSY
ncbi:MAG: DUF2690 domain-containing protein [Angustibacter sp.]